MQAQLEERAAKQLPDSVAATSGHADLKSPAEMSFAELDSTIDAGLLQTRERLLPYLMEMRERLHAQGTPTEKNQNASRLIRSCCALRAPDSKPP